VDAGELAPQRGAKFIGDQQRQKNDADRYGEIFGDFDPEVAIDHGAGSIDHAISIVRRV
jgi:hypothetical protein